MTIRHASLEDLGTIMEIFSHARKFMRDNGNPNQWESSYPPAELIMQEINDGTCFVCESGKGDIVGTFCFIPGEDPTYAHIDDGQWLNDKPYCVIHRMASDGREKGVAAECLKWCFEHCCNIRVDTHKANTVMQNILEKYGFKRCGIIYVRDGSPRIAYQKTVSK